MLYQDVDIHEFEICCSQLVISAKTLWQIDTQMCYEPLMIRYDMTRGQSKEQEETLEDMDKPAFYLFGVKEVRFPCSIDTGLRLWSIILVAGSTLFVSITASINCQAL